MTEGGPFVHLLLLPAQAALLALAGRALLRWLVPASDEDSHPLERVALYYAAGCALLTTLFALVGHVSLSPWLMTGLAVAAALPGLRGMGRPALPRLWPRATIDRVLVVLCIASALVGYIGSLTPEVRHDPLYYHLQVPQLWLNSGRMVEVPENGHSYFPYGFEMVYTWALSLGSDTAAKGHHWLAGLAAAGLAAALARRLGARPLHAAALFLSIPTIPYLSSTTYIDLATAMYGLSAMGALVGMVGRRGAVTVGEGALLGMMTGAAMATKYTAWPLLGVPLGLAAWWAMWGRWGALGATAVAGAVAIAPWVVRNMVYVGNPVAPLLIGVFGPESAHRTGLAGAFDSFSGMGGGAAGWLTAPLSYALHLTHQKYTLALLGLGAAGALLAGRRLRGAATPGRHVAVAAVLLVVLFLFEAAFTRGHPDGRYGLAMQGLAGALVAVLCGALSSQCGRPGACWLAPGLAVAFFVSQAIEVPYRFGALGESLTPILRTESRWQYRIERQRLPADFRERDDRLAAAGAGRVMGLSYPSRHRYWAWIQGIRNEAVDGAGGVAADPAAIAGALAAMGVTHLAGGYNPGFTAEAWAAFLSERTELLVGEGSPLRRLK